MKGVVSRQFNLVYCRVPDNFLRQGIKKEFNWQFPPQLLNHYKFPVNLSGNVAQVLSGLEIEIRQIWSRSAVTYMKSDQ